MIVIYGARWGWVHQVGSIISEEQILSSMRRAKNSTWRGHGGQGPEWHRRIQLWPQGGWSWLSQVDPHVCGSSQGSNPGSATLPHMHRYSLGAPKPGYSARHFGQPHVLEAALLSWLAGP